MGRHYIIDIFSHHNTQVQKYLHSVWTLLSGMQVINSGVFVYDGLIYATEQFSIVRNIMIVGSCFFIPSLFAAFNVYHTLLAIWVCKAFLNSWRLVSAAYAIHNHSIHKWREKRHQSSLLSATSGYDSEYTVGDNASITASS